MHNLTKIKLFRALLWFTFPIACISIYPLAALKRKKRSTIFFFIDRFEIGGAQHVYLDILESVKDKQKTIYFTRKSYNDKFRQAFYSFPATACFDIHVWCDNLLFRVFAVHFYAFYLNRHGNIKIVSSNSTFFYDMLPFLNSRITTVELLHNFSYGKRGMEFFGLANHHFINYRMVIDGYTKENIIRQYQQYGVEEKYVDRVVVAEYGVNIPPRTSKSAGPPLKILYAGRGTVQKRVWILNKVVEHFIEKKLPVMFTFAGPLENDLSEIVKRNCKVLGEVSPKDMNNLFADNHAVILTSAFEGFPVVVKQGMAYGCVPIVTALPANKIHLQHLRNALLVEDPDNEQQVIHNAIASIQMLLDQPGLLETLSLHAYEYAAQHFQKASFAKVYRNLLWD